MARPSGKPKYDLDPKRCVVCNNPIPYEQRRNKYCSNTCKQIDCAKRTHGGDYVGGPNISASNAKYYAKNREKILAQRQAKRAENPGARNQYFADRRAKLKAEKAAEGFKAIANHKETSDE